MPKYAHRQTKTMQNHYIYIARGWRYPAEETLKKDQTLKK